MNFNQSSRFLMTNIVSYRVGSACHSKWRHKIDSDFFHPLERFERIGHQMTPHVHYIENRNRSSMVILLFQLHWVSYCNFTQDISKMFICWQLPWSEWSKWFKPKQPEMSYIRFVKLLKNVFKRSHTHNLFKNVTLLIQHTINQLRQIMNINWLFSIPCLQNHVFKAKYWICITITECLRWFITIDSTGIVWISIKLD